MKPVIAVDGHAGSGKGTISQKIARSFGLAYLDSGLLYRSVAFFDIDENILAKVKVHELINQMNSIPFNALRSEEIGTKASIVSKSPLVRKHVNNFIRDFAENPGEKFVGSIIDGRDIGTVVIPHAICKFFFTADLLVRARRRFKVLRHYAPDLTLIKIFQDMNNRDAQDASRAVAPLIFNNDYVLIDTSNESIRKTFIRVSRIVEKALGSVQLAPDKL